MRFMRTAVLFALWAGVAIISPAHAQSMFANVVATCGTPNSTPVPGGPYPLTIDVTGKLCSSGSGGGGGSAASVEGNATGTGSAQTIFAGSSTATRHVLLQVQGADVWACSFKNATPSISGNVGFQLKAATSNVSGDGGSYATPSNVNDNGTLTCITTGASDHLYWSYQ